MNERIISVEEALETAKAQKQELPAHGKKVQIGTRSFTVMKTNKPNEMDYRYMRPIFLGNHFGQFWVSVF